MIARTILAVMIALCLIGTAMAQDLSIPGFEGAEPEATEPAEASVIAAEPGDDRALARRIRGIFREIDGLDRILVSVDEGVVTLRGRASDPVLIDQAEQLAERVEGVVTVNTRVEEITDLDERLGDAVDRFEDRMWNAIAMLPLLVVAFLVALAVFFLGRFLAARTWPFDRIAPNAFVAGLLRQVVIIGFAIAGLVVALDILNATALISTVLGAAGIVGLAVGFAVRDTVENYVASILLSLRQPFRPGDVVQIDSHLGSVSKLTSRATVLITPDGNHLRIPNATVFKAMILNFTLEPKRRFMFELGVDAESPLARAVHLGVEVLEQLPFTLHEPPPIAWIERVGDSNVVIAYAGWIDQRETDYLKARGEAMRLVKTELETQGFTLPEPIYRLRVDEVPEGLGASPAPRERASSAAERGIAEDVSPDRTIEIQAEVDSDARTTNLLDEGASPEL